MIDFEKVRIETIAALGVTDTVHVLTYSEKETLGYNVTDTYIEVSTKYMNYKGIGEDIKFYLRFPDQFPLVIPKIILPASELKKYRYLPHIEENGGICTFDPESTRTNPDDPIGITKECLRKAKEIINRGCSGSNFNEYEEEFKNYWNIQYGEHDEVNGDMLCLFDGNPDPNKIEFLKVKEETHSFQYILHQGEPHALQFLSYLKLLKYTLEVQPILHLGVITFNFKPPFDFKNREIYRILAGLDQSIQQKYKSYINNKQEPKFISATVITKKKPQLIAWQHKTLDTTVTRKGFRKGSISPFQLLTSFQSNDNIIRSSPVVFTPKQKQFRSSGSSETKGAMKFLLAGLGSLGSNLVYFLNSFNEVEFHLVDGDKLTTENMGRHFLGYSYVPLHKVAAMKGYLINKNPFQRVETKIASIVKIYEESPEFIQECDYIFLLTGKSNIEQYMTSLMDEGKITKPMFLIWVEPYLSAGHCLYLYPGSKTYSDFFDENQLFKYNIIDHTEYISSNPNLLIKEAGCQTTFMPYSQSSVTSFLSAIFPEIKRIINQSSTESQAFSWIGNLNHIQELGIKIATRYSETQLETLINHHE